jgi:CRP-like cAMP-binding protein
MPVSGYALKDSKIMLFSCRKMLTVCSNACRFHTQLVKNLLQVVAEKNVSLSRKIQFMSQKTTKEKLMAYLLDQAKRADSPEFTIPFDRQALADYLGVERSAMSAELSKLRKDGVLISQGSHFILL